MWGDEGRLSGDRTPRRCRAPQRGHGGARCPRPIRKNHARRNGRDKVAGRGAPACLALAGRWGEPAAAVPCPESRCRLPEPVLCRARRCWVNRGPPRSGALRAAARPPVPPCCLRAAVPGARLFGRGAVRSQEDFGVCTAPTLANA